MLTNVISKSVTMCMFEIVGLKVETNFKTFGRPENHVMVDKPYNLVHSVKTFNSDCVKNERKLDQ